MVRFGTLVIALMSAANAWAQADIPADSRLKSIADGKVVRIAYRSDATPFSFVRGGAEPVGFTIDLCRLVVGAMARQLGSETLRIEWVPVTVHTRFSAIEDGKADLECGSSTVTLGRMEQVDFSNLVFVEATTVLVRRDSAIRSFADMNGKKIAAVAGTSNERAVADHIRRLKLDAATMIGVEDGKEGVAAVESGRADGYASDRLLIAGAAKQNPQALVMVPDELSIEPYAIALPRGDWALRLAVNRGLAHLFRTGAAEDVFKRWFDQIGLRYDGLLLAAHLLGRLAD